ncbi:MAG TPA: tetratricopeptide repeat protein [bacterium]|jgi:tetratricopeptide (TPR) repeat protein|nr:tetratricopeptide repeat protein [bacterium]
MLKPERGSGGGPALAFCIGGAFAALVLLPTTQLLDLKACAAMALACLLCLGLALPGGAAAGPARPPKAMALAWGAAGLAFLLCRLASPYRSLVSGLDGSALAGVLLCFCLASGPRAWGRAVLRTWPWAALVLAAYALAQRAGFEPISAYALAGSSQRAMGSFGNAGCLAAFLCLSWPMVLSWNGLRRAGALTLLFSALVATQSRAALLAVLVQGLCLGYLLWSRRGRPESARSGTAPAWTRGPLAGLVAALGLSLLALYLFPPSAWLRPTARWPLWQASFQLWTQRPLLGWGPGSFALAFQDHATGSLVSLVNSGNQYAEDPHQLLLAVACAGGLPGLAALAFGCAVFFRQALRSASAEAPLLALGGLGLLVEAQADRFFFLPGVFVPLCAAFGLLAADSKDAGAQVRAEPERGAAPEWLSLLFLGLAFVFARQAYLPLARNAQGVGPALDAEVGSLAVAGDPTALAAQASKGDPLALEKLGDALAAQRRYAEAADALAKALAIQPTRGRAQNLGNCSMMLGDYKAAEAAFRQAVALEPSSADAHFSLGYALFYQKRLKEAVAELDMALRLDPSHAGAMQLKKQILQ